MHDTLQTNIFSWKVSPNDIPFLINYFVFAKQIKKVIFGKINRKKRNERRLKK